MYCALLGFDAPRCGVDYRYPLSDELHFIDADEWTDGYFAWSLALDDAGDYWSCTVIPGDPDDPYDRDQSHHAPCFLGPRPAPGTRIPHPRFGEVVLRSCSMPSDCIIDAVADGYRWEQP